MLQDAWIPFANAVEVRWGDVMRGLTGWVHKMNISGYNVTGCGTFTSHNEMFKFNLFHFHFSSRINNISFSLLLSLSALWCGAWNQSQSESQSWDASRASWKRKHPLHFVHEQWAVNEAYLKALLILFTQVKLFPIPGCFLARTVQFGEPALFTLHFKVSWLLVHVTRARAAEPADTLTWDLGGSSFCLCTFSICGTWFWKK